MKTQMSSIIVWFIKLLWNSGTLPQTEINMSSEVKIWPDVLQNYRYWHLRKAKKEKAITKSKVSQCKLSKSTYKIFDSLLSVCCPLLRQYIWTCSVHWKSFPWLVPANANYFTNFKNILHQIFITKFSNFSLPITINSFTVRDMIFAGIFSTSRKYF